MPSTVIQDVPCPPQVMDVPARAVRFPDFVGLNRDLHQILDELDVYAIGTGAVGMDIATAVAQFQPRSLTLVDPDSYVPENLLTQRITADAIGSNKADYVGRLCARISPRTRVRMFPGRAEDLPLGALSSAHFVFLATDNLSVEVEVSQRCLHAGVPLVQASVGGEMLVAQIRFCGNADGNGPCLACGFGTAEWEHVNRESVFSCQGGYDDDVRPQPANRVATRSVGPLCSIAAGLASIQMLRYLGGLGPPVVDTCLEICGYTHHTAITRLTRNNNCPCEHRRFERCRLPRPVASFTPRELVETALGSSQTLVGVSLTIDRLQFCEAGVCTNCSRRQPVERFVGSLRGIDKCSECGASVDGLPFNTHRPTPLAVLASQLDSPLDGFTDKAPEAAVVRGPNVSAICEYSGAGNSSNSTQHPGERREYVHG